MYHKLSRHFQLIIRRSDELGGSRLEDMWHSVASILAHK